VILGSATPSLLRGGTSTLHNFGVSLLLWIHPVTQNDQIDVVYMRGGGMFLQDQPLLNGRCTSLLRVVVSEMTYTVLSGTLNSSIPYHTIQDQPRSHSKGATYCPFWGFSIYAYILQRRTTTFCKLTRGKGTFFLGSATPLQF